MFDERARVLNELYALIFPVLAKYETRGFNAHQRTQNIAMTAADEMQDWISRQAAPKTPDTKEEV